MNVLGTLVGGRVSGPGNSHKRFLRVMIERTAFSLECYRRNARERIDCALAEYTSLDRGCPDQLREAIRYSP